MAIYYIENENGSFASADGTRRFIKLSGKEALDYLRTEEGCKKRFMRTSRHEDGGEEEFVEVTPEYLKQHRREERRKQYVSDCIENSEIISISLYAMQADENDDIISGEELIADPAVDVEEQALLEIRLEMLHRALKTLTDEELQLIQALYLGKNECSERKIAAEMGLSQVAIHKRKKAVLEKLKNFFEF